MKIRIFVLLMVAVMLLTFAACGGDDQTPPTPTNGQQESTHAPTGDDTVEGGTQGGEPDDGMPAASEDLSYTLNDDGTAYTVSGIGTYMDTELFIPATYQGFPVTSIGKDAFFECSSLMSVMIPDRATLPSLHPQNNYCTL